MSCPSNNALVNSSDRQCAEFLYGLARHRGASLESLWLCNHHWNGNLNRQMQYNLETREGGKVVCLCC